MLFPRTLKQLQVDSATISLRWLLVIPVVLLTTGTTALVGYLSYRSGQQAAADLAERLMDQTSDRVTQELKTYLQTPILINRLNVDAVQQQQIDLQNLPDLESALFYRLQQFDQVTALLFASPEGVFRGIERSPALNLVVANPDRPDITQVYRLNPQGQRQALSNTLKGVDVRRSRPWYKNAVQTGKLGWNPIFQHGSYQALVLNASQPVYDPTTQRLLGVFSVHIRLDYLSQFLHSLEISRTGQILILDQNNELIATSTLEPLDQTETGAGFYRQFKQLTIQDSQNELTRSLGQALRDRDNRQTALTQDKFTLYNEGNRYFVQTVPFQDSYGLQWRVLTVVPQSDFTAQIQQNVHTTIVLCLLALSGAIVLSVIISGRVTDRVCKLNDASQALAVGDLSRRLPENSAIGEMRQLATSFNQMAEQLGSLFQGQVEVEATRQTEAVLRKSEADLKRAQRIARCGSWEYTLATERLYWSEEMYRIHGLEPGQTLVMGEAAMVYIHPDDHDKYRQEVLAKAYKQQPFESDMRIIHPDGTILYVESRGEPVFDEQQNLLALRGTVQDVTDRKQVEAALRQSEANLKKAQEIAHVGHWEYNLATSKVYWSEELCRIHGLETDHRITYADAVRFTHPDDNQKYREEVLDKIAAETSFATDLRIVRDDGAIRFIETRGEPIFDAHHQLIGLRGTVQDITDRKLIEDALRQSEERWQLAIAGANDGIWDHNLLTEKLFLSPRCLEMLGYCSEEIATFDKWVQRIHPIDLPRIVNTLQQYLNRETPHYVAEYRMQCRDGTYKWILSRGQAIWNQEAIAVRMVGFITDISDRRKLEEMKDEFISIVSHELRTPLTSILGSLGILDMGVLEDDPETAQQMLTVALRNTERLVRLVNDILDLERLESGAAPLEKKSCKVSDLIEQAIESVQTIADQAEVTLQSMPLSALVQADPDAIVQTLTNLLSNAIKFSPAGSTVYLRAELQGGEEWEMGSWGDREIRRWGVGNEKTANEKTANGKIANGRMRKWSSAAVQQCSGAADQTAHKAAALAHPLTPSPPPSLRFSVSDQGRGIPPEKLESIFGRFQQVDSSDARQRGGTGLGLAICKSIVQQHQGSIWVESIVGQGSIFYFTLPADS